MATAANLALPVYFNGDPGQSIFFSLQRWADGLRYDFQSGQFSHAPVWLVQQLSPDSGPDSGGYQGGLTQTPQAVFPDGWYLTRFHRKPDPNTWDMQAISGAFVRFQGGVMIG